MTIQQIARSDSRRLKRKLKGRPLPFQLDLLKLMDATLEIVKARNNRAAWDRALREAAEVREFPNLLFAERWITALVKARVYPGSWRLNSE